MTTFYHAVQRNVVQLPLFVLSKVCTKCGVEKSIDKFPVGQGLGGKRADCTQCRVAANRERKLHPERKPAPRKPALSLVTSSRKVCATCGKEKDIDEFSPRKKGVYGRKRHCKACVNAELRAERALKNAFKPIPRRGYRFCSKCNRELLYPQEFVKRAAECKDCKAASTHARRDTPEFRESQRLKHRTPERLVYNEAYYTENKEMFRANGQAWRKANPEKGRNANLRRKAGKLNAVVEPVDYKHILERDGLHCYICDKPIDPTAKRFSSAALTFDHKVPLQPRPGEPQGNHTEDNIHPAHHACNVRKGNIPFEQLTPWQRRGV